jgi:CelD/BcsL family acetyltransferase involved in cellulose biosynthesis
MVCTLRDEHEHCAGIVPLILTTRGLGKLRVRSVDFLGPDKNLTEIRRPLIAPGMDLRVALAVRRTLARGKAWDWIHWSGIDGAFGHALAESGPLEWREPIVDYVISLPDTWEAFRPLLKRNIRESLRHCYNSLKRDGLDFTFVVAQTPTEVRAGLEHFFLLHSKRAAQSGLVSHPDRFPNRVSKAFLHEVCERLAAKGIARVFLLKIRDEVVAARIAFRVRDSLYLYYSGFDPKWAKYSVMTTTLAEILKYAISANIATVNLSTGTDVSKTRWPVRAVHFQCADEEGPRLRSRLAFAAYRHLTSADTPAWAAPLLRLLPRRAVSVGEP